MRYINNSELLFGGKIIIFSGDFCKVLPVVYKGTREEHLYASIAAYYVWPILKKITLNENMWVRLDPNFLDYLLQSKKR